MLIKPALVFIVRSNGFLSNWLICYLNKQACHSANTLVNDPICHFLPAVFKHKEDFHHYFINRNETMQEFLSEFYKTLEFP